MVTAAVEQCSGEGLEHQCLLCGFGQHHVTLNPVIVQRIQGLHVTSHASHVINGDVVCD